MRHRCRGDLHHLRVQQMRKRVRKTVGFAVADAEHRICTAGVYLVGDDAQTDLPGYKDLRRLKEYHKLHVAEEFAVCPKYTEIVYLLCRHNSDVAGGGFAAEPLCGPQRVHAAMLLDHGSDPFQRIIAVRVASCYEQALFVRQQGIYKRERNVVAQIPVKSIVKNDAFALHHLAACKDGVDTQILFCQIPVKMCRNYAFCPVIGFLELSQQIRCAALRRKLTAGMR